MSSTQDKILKAKPLPEYAWCERCNRFVDVDHMYSDKSCLLECCHIVSEDHCVIDPKRG